jgi:acyl carrier protein
VIGRHDEPGRLYDLVTNTGVAMAVADIIKSIIIEQLGVDDDEVTLDASFTDDLGADSMDLVELVMAVEEEFGIEIPDEDAETLSTVKELVEYVIAHPSDGAQPPTAGDADAPQVGATPSPGETPDVEAPGPSGAGDDLTPDVGTPAPDGDPEDDTIYAVVVNAGEQYAIWPAYKDDPTGWHRVGPTATKAECLAYIAEIGGDLRPQSLREQLEPD